MTYRYLVIDPDQNMLLCSQSLVGSGELVEIHAPDDDTPRQACGRILQKLENGMFEVHQSFDGHDALGRKYNLGQKCVLRVLSRNLSGTRRRRFSVEEKEIVPLEKGENFQEKKVARAKTGSVRRKK
jgi:hypothetical protein